MKKLGARVFWCLQYWSLVVGQEQFWAFGIMLYHWTSNLAAKVCRRINGHEIYIDTPLPRRRACPDVIQHHLPPLCVVTGLPLPRFSAPLCKRPTSRSGVSFGRTASELSPHVLPRVHRGKCPQLQTCHSIVDRTGYRGLDECRLFDS